MKSRHLCAAAAAATIAALAAEAAGADAKLPLSLPAAIAASQPAAIELPRAESAVVLEYDVVHSMLEERDPEPLLRIYADGTVKVHLPAYMSRAGDYRTRLSRVELEGLFADLAADGIFDFDAEAVRSEKRRTDLREIQAGRLWAVSDPSFTIIDLAVASYRPPGALAPVSGFRKKVTWPNVHTDARRYRGIAEIQSLSRAERRLRSLLERDDLAEVR